MEAAMDDPQNRQPDDGRRTLKHVACDACHGTGKIEGMTCPECKGKKFKTMGTRGAEK